MEVEDYPNVEEADELASLEYTNLESEGLTALTRQIQVENIYKVHLVSKANHIPQAQTSVDQRESVDNDNTHGPGDDNDNEESSVATRNLTQDTVLHCDSINYDMLCALAGTSNLGGVRNFTMRVRWRIYKHKQVSRPPISNFEI